MFAQQQQQTAEAQALVNELNATLSSLRDNIESVEGLLSDAEDMGVTLEFGTMDVSDLSDQMSLMDSVRLTSAKVITDLVTE